MLTLINTNLMKPPIAPIGLDYIASSAGNGGIDVEILDLCMSENYEQSIRQYFSNKNPMLTGLSVRNVDDCFWPSAQSFIDRLKDIIFLIRRQTASPIVLGGVGFSIFSEQIMKVTDAEFGICGDGERPIVELYNCLSSQKDFSKVPGLIWNDKGTIHKNPPNWPLELSVPTDRSFIDNKTYFRKGGQIGIETKRGCNRLCVYCADPLAKGTHLRTRKPAEVADEIENLLKKNIDVFHLCDSEFNIPIEHAKAVCIELISRRLGEKIRWYAYLGSVPFDGDLAQLMHFAGCVGINFTADSASAQMLKLYGQKHTKDDIASAISLCRKNEIAVMTDLLLGGPGENPQTAKETIEFFKQTKATCIGTALGLRIYPNTEIINIIQNECPIVQNPGIKRKYSGDIDLLLPTFYISPLLGEKPAELICDLIAGDKRFFEPIKEDSTLTTDHNYNDNAELSNAIAQGARGAYWHILHKLRC